MDGCTLSLADDFDLFHWKEIIFGPVKYRESLLKKIIFYQRRIVYMKEESSILKSKSQKNIR